ncbi:acyltransferase [Acinetobacter apis]|uniref:Peptidoglycan/LPS O-acetylase OafA/YrhL, contains acyltransferase and SGNH-hydrolase domains n=1 Tax=Acinetobacter apis TaxID=1229165 RepID=A0A217EH30_9GAMM|nr:Peptidoglycan/LPS O-acetylase OafA/YrhL, contains acyltransferase and SGNH-hydrolase domains [Acinetobacter apis]
MSKKRDPPNEFIDVLRFISIMLVLIHHFNIPYKLSDTWITFSILDHSFITLLARNGNYGVTMFFVISGYLITFHALQRWKELKNIDYKVFYLLRCARIIPTLFLLVIVVNILGMFGLKPFITQTSHELPMIQSLVNLAALTFWMNILIIHEGWVNYALGVLWSLSVEEVFYVIFPLLAICLKKEYFFYVVCLVVIGICPYFRALTITDENGAYLYHYLSSIDGIAFGCLTALISRRVSITKNSHYFKYVMMMCLILIYFSGPIRETCVWGVSAFSLCSSVLILTSVSHPIPVQDNLISRVIKRIGRNSYEIYLFHLVILGLIKVVYLPQETSGNIKLLLLLTYLVVTFLFSFYIEKFFSHPINYKIRKRLIEK